jgi:hypothetical protein
MNKHCIFHLNGLQLELSVKRWNKDWNIWNKKIDFVCYNEDFAPNSEHLQSLSLEECNCSSSFSQSDVIKYVCFSPPQPLKIKHSTAKVKKKSVILSSHITTIYILKVSWQWKWIFSITWLVKAKGLKEINADV